MVTLEGLWPALKSGGIYVIEDVQTSYFGDRHMPQLYKPTGPKAIMPWVARMTQLVHCPAKMNVLYEDKYRSDCRNATDLEKQVLSIEVQNEAVVLVKR